MEKQPMKQPRNKIRELANDESGSLTLLISSLFFVTLILSFAIIDIAGALVAKRQLVNIGESAISRAAHSIDLTRYYSGEFTISGVGASGVGAGGVGASGVGAGGERYLVPIDCSAASSALESEIAGSRLHQSPVNILSFSCEGDVIQATISSQVAPLLALPMLRGSVMNQFLNITATVSASNEIGAG
jgi:Flp pilus assembly protein TadG